LFLIWPIFISMAYWEHLDLDEKTRKALKIRDFEKRKTKIFLFASLVVVLVITSLLFCLKIISSQAFELIFSAIIGGFVGSSISYIVKED